MKKLWSIVRFSLVTFIKALFTGYLAYLLLALKFTLGWFWSFFDVNWYVILVSFVVGAEFMYLWLDFFRNTKLRNIKPFYFYFDDEVPDSKDFVKWLDGRKFNYWLRWLWHGRRNRWWNGQMLFVIKGLKKWVSSKGSHSRDGNSDISIFEACVLKFLDKDLNFSWFKGHYLSLEHSVIGSMLVWYKNKGKLYFQYSYAKKVIGRFWVEIQFGTFDRYKQKFKIKYIKNII